MRLIDWASAWFKAHPAVVDSAAVGLVLFLAMTDLATGGFESSQRAPDPLAYVLLAAQIVPFVFRRRYPFAVMYTMVAALGLYWILEYPAGSDASGIVAIYSGVAYGMDRRRTWVNAATAIAIMTATASLLANGFFTGGDDVFTPFVVVAVLAIHLAAAVFGEVVYQHRQRNTELRARAAQAEAEVETRARLAAVEERTRIAREMHDIVAHGMSVISVQAAAAQEVARSDPDRTIGILEDIEATGREALIEMRRMLGVLRNGPDRPGALSPQPSLADLDLTIAQRVEAGLPTQLIITGEERPLSPGLELAAFRIIQEALTNVLKHAGDAATATIALGYQSTALEITITDTGQGAASNLTNSGSGNGLIGMRERVDAYNGHVTAGPRPGGGYEVRASLPLDNEAARHRPAPAEPSNREQLT
jgi:signal transduction histidine kinase